MRRQFAAVLLTLFSLTSARVHAARATAGIPASYLNGLSWRLVGPWRGGRALAVTGVPGQPDHYYFGAVDGGVWESTNAGRTWNPVFDDEHIGSIGAIAVSPSDPKTIYVGSGEADMRSDISYGNGMYKSNDGGKTWSHIGLDDSRQIGAIAVDPHDANIAYVAALGHQYGPSAERGVFKTSDGGASWHKVLFKNDNTGAVSLALDPQNPQTVYAALWQTRRPPWNTYPPSNGPGSGLYKSTDGGATWTQLTNGLPKSVGRIGIAVAPSMPSRIYASVGITNDPRTGGVYRSDDGGTTWTHVDGGLHDPRIWQRGWYFSGITVDTKNPDIVYVMDTATYRSDDGGKNFVAIKGAPGGDDYHTLWVNPDDPTHMILGSDQGVQVSVDRAKTWSSWYNQPTAQLYHIITDNHFFYNIYGAQQDSGAIAGPSQTKHSDITQADWRAIDVGGENGYIQPVPGKEHDLIGGSDTVTDEDLSTGWERNIDPQTAYPDKYWRHTWTLPVVFSPVDRALYTSRQQIFRSRNDGNSWQIISPDLTGPASEDFPKNLDPTTLRDNDGVPRRGVVYSIAPSPFDASTIWAGTDDGSVWITRNAGTHWQNITPPGLRPWSKISVIETSKLDRNTAYMAVDRHRVEDYRPYIYKTVDGGAHWSAIASGIPDGSFVRVVRADPIVRGLLYAGTELGVYVSFDDGAHWQSFQRNLPVSSVRDIQVHGNDLIAGTHGRSIWVMDDIAPLRDMARAVDARVSYLFAPPTSYRLRRAGDFGFGVAEEGTPISPEEPQSANVPVGMFVDYYLQGAAQAAVTISFVSPRGEVLRTYSSSAKVKPIDPAKQEVAPRWLPLPVTVPTDPGAHRFIWDFSTRHDGGPLAPPGRYTIRLTVNGKTYTRTAMLERDPRINVTDRALWQQFTLATAIEAKLAQVEAARAHALSAIASKKLSAAQLSRVQMHIVGVAVPESEDMPSMPPAGFTTLRYLGRQFASLESSVEAADAAPTRDQQIAFTKLTHALDRTIAAFAAIAGPK